MDAPLPFDVAEHLTTVRLELHRGQLGGGGLVLVLLVAPIGLIGAFWRVRGQWTDAPIGRA